MSAFTVLALCLQACLLQNALAYIPEPAFGYAPGFAAPGLGYGLGPAAFAAPFGAPILEAPCSAPYGAPFGAPILEAPFSAPYAAPFAAPFNAYEAPLAGAYGGEGIGDVAVAGEMPVAGTTLVTGQVPILGAVRFAGDLPAGGVVSISGSSGYGRAPFVC